MFSIMLIQTTETQNCVSEDCIQAIFMAKMSLLGSLISELLFTICVRIPCNVMLKGFFNSLEVITSISLEFRNSLPKVNFS